MFNFNPFGIVKTAPDCTITFAVVIVTPRVQLDEIIHHFLQKTAINEIKISN